jgi:hypothetical protein
MARLPRIYSRAPARPSSTPAPATHRPRWSCDEVTRDRSATTRPPANSRPATTPARPSSGAYPPYPPPPPPPLPSPPVPGTDPSPRPWAQQGRGACRSYAHSHFLHLDLFVGPGPDVACLLPPPATPRSALTERRLLSSCGATHLLCAHVTTHGNIAPSCGAPTSLGPLRAHPHAARHTPAAGHAHSLALMCD